MEAAPKLHLTMRELPAEERPRERMLQSGPEALSNAELLAILLRTGTAEQSVIRLGEQLLCEAGGLRGLVGMSTAKLMRIRGIGAAKAMQVQAGIELGRRLARMTSADKVTIRSPRDAAELMMDEMRFLNKEHFVALFLNTKNHLIAKETLSIGSLNASIVHPRELFRAAIERGAASIICLHNHPSGDPTPSREDIELTVRLDEAGKLLGIELLDHIVIGDSRWISFKEQGLF
ncbi:DNA repair protein RadC [Paenibacillus chartarius]|uniref:DNA repair protein RadC n=1 Tax=Paenibacillus chartarius TaxID=747481 RepID=A0ABV6DIX0_9BACL